MAALAAKYGEGWVAIRDSLQASFEEFARHGFCLSLGDWDRNVMAAGVPLHLADGSIMALTCGAPSFQLSEETLRARWRISWRCWPAISRAWASSLPV